MNSSPTNHRIPSIPILMYHGVSEVSERSKKNRSTNPAYSLSVKQFREQMEYLHTNGYKTLRLDQLLYTTSLISHEKVIPAKAGIQKDAGFRIRCGMTDSLRSMSLYIDDKTQVSQKSLVITFDDGLVNNYTNVFPILKEYGLTATIFVIMGFVGQSDYMDWHQIKEMNREGMSVQSHTVSHQPLVGLNDDQLLYELAASKNLIEDHLGSQVDFLSLPHGMFNKKVIDTAQEAGYKAICTSEPGFSHTYGNPPILKRINISGRYQMATFEKIIQRNQPIILSLMFSKKFKNMTKKVLGYNNYRKLYQLRYMKGLNANK